MSPSGAEPTALLVARSGLDATGVDGTPASSVEYRVQAERTVGLLGRVLAQLHATDPGPSPAVPARPAAAIAAEVRAAHDAGRLPPHPRSSAYAHLGDDRLVAVLEQGADEVDRRADRPVLTHGAPSLARLRCNAGTAVGLVDWHLAGVGDRYRDLAVAARSVAIDLTPVLVPVLFESYGERSPDPVRLDWYSLAAELLVAPDPPDPPDPPDAPDGPGPVDDEVS